MTTADNSAAHIRYARWLTLAGYFALISGIYLWHIVIHKTEHNLVSLVLVLQLGPLMLPLRGLLHARIYTHAWSMYLGIFYFVVGVWYSSAPESLSFGLFLVCASLAFFVGSLLFTRLSARAEKATAAKD
jgi:uncharacterized membrane protein